MNEPNEATLLSIAEAKERIDTLLEKYGETCRIEFRKTDAEITDSYLVTSMEDRHNVCKLIASTGITDRTYEDLSAEWELHNAAYTMHVARAAAKDVSLDYGGDPRFVVRLATKIFDVLDIE